MSDFICSHCASPEKPAVILNWTPPCVVCGKHWQSARHYRPDIDPPKED